MKQLVAAIAFALTSAMAWAAHPTVEMKTSLGTIVIELYEDKAPKTVENFVQYVQEGFFNGTVFHRVVPGFVVQGGGFDKSDNQKPTRAPITNEAANGLKNARGTLSMARTMDPNSATSQFFINVVDNAMLDFRDPSPRGIGYAVFGKVVSGMDTVEKIRNAPTGAGGPFPTDVPQKMVVIESARVL